MSHISKDLIYYLTLYAKNALKLIIIIMIINIIITVFLFLDMEKQAYKQEIIK